MARLVRRLCLVLALLAGVASAHVVTHLYGEWDAETRELRILFDAGYAVPEWRGDADTPPPERAWLVGLGEPGWSELRRESEAYLRECLVLKRDGGSLPLDFQFPDFESEPPDFPKLLNDLAYFNVTIDAETAETLRWLPGRRPQLVLKTGGGYVTLPPGESASLGQPQGRPRLLTTFVQGFLHVVPAGWDHVLFILGLFFYQRKWRPLIAQSLAFTAAHTVTLGLAAGGIVNLRGNWVEPLIALSIAAVAIENLFRRENGAASSGWRLTLVFGFGLIHGLGFAGALSSWLQPGDGFLPALVTANLGVEAAQAAVLLAAWILTIHWHESRAYPAFRTACCAAIALTGLVLAAERMAG